MMSFYRSLEKSCQAFILLHCHTVSAVTSCYHLSTDDVDVVFVYAVIQSYVHYRISSVIRRSFSLPNNPKNPEPSYKTDLDLWDFLGRVKIVL